MCVYCGFLPCIAQRISPWKHSLTEKLDSCDKKLTIKMYSVDHMVFFIKNFAAFFLYGFFFFFFISFVILYKCFVKFYEGFLKFFFEGAYEE